MSNPILFLEEGFISREVAEAVDSIFLSANLKWTSYRIENLRLNASMRMGPFFEAPCSLFTSGLE
jgi:hypothetical protein